MSAGAGRVSARLETPVALSSRTAWLTRWVLLPCAIYLAGFIVFTWPLITQFSTHFFADMGDGLQNVWNIWWVNKAVTELHTSPWHTHHLFCPVGVNLLPHTPATRSFRV